jgi:hypothetical protein
MMGDMQNNIMRQEYYIGVLTIRQAGKKVMFVII